MTTAIKSVSVSLEMIELCKKHRISMTEATRVGISVILSELGEPQFLNKLNIGRKVSNMAGVILDLQKRLDVFENVMVQK